MKYGARNKIIGKVTSIKSDPVMSLVKFDVTTPAQMASVVTTESVQELGLYSPTDRQSRSRFAR